MTTGDTGRRVAVPLLTTASVVVALVAPPLLAVRLGSGDAARVFVVTWLLALVGPAAGTAVAWWTLRRPADPVRTALERALTLVVPLVVVALVGAPWILSVFGRDVRDTGVGSLVLFALAAVPYTVVATASRAAALRGRAVGAVVPLVAAVAVAGALAWVATPVVGVVGAAFGWLVGWSAAALFRFRSVLTRSVARSAHGRNRMRTSSLIDPGR